MNFNAHEDEDFIARIAWLYYKEKLNQQQIADNLSLSRQKVQRMLERARDLDIIHFFVKHPNYNILSVERDLARTFGLRDAVVIPHVEGDEDQLRRAIAKAGAGYFETIKRTEKIKTFGIGWGRMLSYAADYFINTTTTQVRLASILGSVDGVSEYDSLHIIMKLASKMGVPSYPVLGPAVAETGAAAEYFRSEPLVNKSLSLAEEASNYLISVGIFAEDSYLFTDGIFPMEDYKRLSGKGAAAEIVGRFIDAEGRLIEDEINDRVVGISLEKIRDSRKTVICIAGGISKFRAIRSALLGKYIDILITDESVAEKLMNGT